MRKNPISEIKRVAKSLAKKLIFYTLIFAMLGAAAWSLIQAFELIYVFVEHGGQSMAESSEKPIEWVEMLRMSAVFSIGGIAWAFMRWSDDLSPVQNSRDKHKKGGEE